MMRIAFIVPSLANKGPVAVVNDISSLLHKQGEKVEVFYFDDKVELSFSAPVRRISEEDRLDFSQFDIIHSHGFRPDKFIWKNRKNIRAKCVSTMHNYMEADLRHQYNPLVAMIFTPVWRFFLRRHDHLIALSNDMAGYYARYFNSSLITTIYNGRDPMPYVKDEYISIMSLLENLRKKFTILGVVAQLTKRKGIDQIIRALPSLPNACVVIAGDGKEKRALEELAVTVGVADRCQFLGYLPNGQALLPHIDVYLMLSRSEGFPLSLLEAAAAKKAVICSRIPIFEEVFSESEVGFFELDNQSSLIRTVSETLQNREKLSCALHNRYLANFTVSAMVERHKAFYRSIINRFK